MWDTSSGNFSITEGEDRHGPSQIPTDVDLPHKTFGSQLVDDSPFERPDVLPFSTYAACRILDTNPEDIVSRTPVMYMLTMSCQAPLNGFCLDTAPCTQHDASGVCMPDIPKQVACACRVISSTKCCRLDTLHFIHSIVRQPCSI